MKSILKAVTVAALAFTASTVFAQGWSVKVGVNQLTPKVTSGDMSAPSVPGTKSDVGADTQPIVALGYQYDDNIAVELDLGLPYKHKLYGAGAIAGVGQIGTVEALPPTIFGKYLFLDAQTPVRPFVGLGLTYAAFQKETGSGTLTALTNPGGPGTTFKVDPTFGFAVQLGGIYDINEEWFADVSVTKSYLKTTTKFSTGQTIDMKLDPVALAVAVGYKF
ncbi:MAG: OmpW family protein [Sideroxydans sp.]|nr:OmpW family protein [Sideroxydans sp.]